METTNDLAYLLAVSDYVSLHLPATPETRGLIGEARAARDEADRVPDQHGARRADRRGGAERALEEGWIAGAALDVLAEEPARAGHPLPRLDNAIVTPHAGFYSEPAIADLATRAAGNVAAVLRGELPPTVVNPAVVDLPAYRLGRALG